MAGGARVEAGGFYAEWAGHRPRDLAGVLRGAAGRGAGAARRDSAADAALGKGRRVLWLLGDSSLDNKFWLQFCPPPRRAQALNGYERALRPGDLMHRDVCYWLNRAALDAGLDVVCVNAAVEASTLGERGGACGRPRLLPQDRFVAENLLPDDVLCVSVGGNDIAMRPTLATVFSMLALVRAPPERVESGCALGLQHFVRLFRDDMRRYVERVLDGRPVAAVAVCFIYYPCLEGQGGWADGALALLRYDRDPGRLQLIMREIFRQALSGLRIPGIRVVPIPLYESLDPADPGDYVARVEPSVLGGKKLARGILARLQPVLEERR